MRKALTAIALAIAFSPSARATNGMRMIGFGPVQDAMGGASVALPLDAGTVVTNPAGLLSLGQRLDVAGTYFSPTVKYQATDATGSGQYVASPGSLSSDFGASFIPAVGYVRPLSDGLAAGLGLYGAAGMGVDYGANLYNGVTKSSYMQGRLTPGVAYRVVEGLTAGVTVNAMYATMSYDVAGGFGMPRRKNASALGIGAVIGLQYAVVPAVTIGAAYETQSWFQDFEFDIPSHTQATPGGPVTFPGGTEKLAFDQPPVATLGFAVRPLDALVIALDGEYIFWSQTNGRDAPKITGGEATGAMPFDMHWDDQLVVKVGAQYAATRELKLRAGYNYGKSPLDATRAFENIAFPAIAEHHITAGVGYDVASWSVNVAAMYVPEAKLSGANPAQGLSSYTTKMSQLQIDVGASYRF